MKKQVLHQENEGTYLCLEYCVNADVLDCQKVADDIEKTRKIKNIC